MKPIIEFVFLAVPLMIWHMFTNNDLEEARKEAKRRYKKALDSLC